jgi:hypothetical protein
MVGLKGMDYLETVVNFIDMRNSYKTSFENLLGRLRCVWEDNIRMYLKNVGLWGGVCTGFILWRAVRELDKN